MKEFKSSTSESAEEMEGICRDGRMNNSIKMKKRAMNGGRERSEGAARVSEETAVEFRRGMMGRYVHVRAQTEKGNE